MSYAVPSGDSIETFVPSVNPAKNCVVIVDLAYLMENDSFTINLETTDLSFTVFEYPLPGSVSMTSSTIPTKNLDAPDPVYI